MLTELGDATGALANEKCPGPDGAPAEFYKANWDTVGPLVLQCLTSGISNEHFPESVTRGVIVLLPKKSDQRMLTNKRPITLLNTSYKIEAKALQKRLTPILQRIISFQQAAFLPGRNIHHALLYLSELLHQAHLNGKEYILMKLDVCKAFDRLEWSFILQVVERAGLAGLLSRFLKASFSTASSHVVLNGRPTQAIRLARSVRQGCPLSPLVFILAYDSLNHVIKDAVARQALVGVFFPEWGYADPQSMYADDSDLLIEAQMEYVMESKRILQCFGAASGLHCVWEPTKAAFIPGGPPPLIFWLLPWVWEEDSNATPKLGVPIASSISPQQMEALVQRKLNSGIQKYKGKNLSLAARIVVANSLILNTLWYLLTLWAGEPSFLRKIQRQIDAFVWDGRPRVDYMTITQGKAKGGLGLLSVQEQYNAIAGNLMLWILGPGQHPLQIILRSHVSGLSAKRWGVPDLAWLVTHGGGKNSGGSAPWRNICRAWGELKTQVVPLTPQNLGEWLDLPIWRPHCNHVDSSLIKCTSRAQQELRRAGLVSMRDVMAPGGGFLQWEGLPPQIVATGKVRAYRKILSNLRVTPIIEPTPGPHPIFFAEPPEEHGHRIWQFDVAPQDRTSNWPHIARLYNLAKTLRARADQLTTIPCVPPPNDLELHRVNLRLPWGKGARNQTFGPLNQASVFLIQHGWQDGIPLLHTSTAQLRNIQAQQRLFPHLALEKWRNQLGSQVPTSIWGQTWLNFRSANENTFLWQLIYRVIATQRWRFPTKSPLDPSTWCTRCNLGIREDIMHCIWSCPHSRGCWHWGETLLTASSQNGTLCSGLLPGHVFLAQPLPDH